MLKLRDFRFYNAGDGGGSGTTPTTGDPASTQTATTTGGQTTDPASGASGSVDAEALKRELAEARKEAAKYRTERNSFEADLKKRTDAELTEAERLKAQAEDAVKSLSAMEHRVVKSEVKLAAQAAKIVNPDDAYKLIKDEIEVKDGEAVNIDALIAGLVKDKPYLLAQEQQSDGGAGNPARGGTPPADIPIGKLSWSEALKAKK